MDLNGVFGSFLTHVFVLPPFVFTAMGEQAFAVQGSGGLQHRRAESPAGRTAAATTGSAGPTSPAGDPASSVPASHPATPATARLASSGTVVKTFLNKCKNPWTPFWALKMSPAALSYLPNWHRKQWMLTDRVHSLYILWKIWGIDLKMFVSAAPQQQVIVQESKLIHMGGTGMVSGS